MLTLVADQPAHPILNGVFSFNGGTNSFLNSPIMVAPGASLLAHWNNNQPLVATKQLTAGRMVGLNFYPPSSDSRNDFWNAATDGARLMANALLWAGKQSPMATNLINFDDLAAPTGFISTTRLTNRYQSLGVIFEGPGGLDGGAVLNENSSFGVSGYSRPNFLAFNTNVMMSDGGLARGPETIRFTPSASFVRLLA